MIISCEKCNKKFELEDNLIPESGRLLQCGSCSHKWHYIPEKIIKLDQEIGEINENTLTKDKIKVSKVQKKNKTKKKVSYQSRDEVLEQKEKKVGLLSYLLAIIISLVAIIIIIDTFKIQLSVIVPNIDLYILSLHQTLIDIFLFFKDLIK